MNLRSDNIGVLMEMEVIFILCFIGARIGLEVSRDSVDESERSVQVIVRVLEGNLRRDVVLGLSTLSKNASGKLTM